MKQIVQVHNFYDLVHFNDKSIFFNSFNAASELF